MKIVTKQEQTPTPIIYVDKIVPGTNQIGGWVGTFDKAKQKIAEDRAEILVYINGFLQNPKVFLPNGQIDIEKTIVITTDNEGNWLSKDIKIANYFNSTIQQVLTVKAKSPNKSISEESVPYVIRGMVTPINIGVPGDYGIMRPPYKDEYTLYGQFSYWNSSESPNDPIFGCNNRVFIYADNIRIGEVLKNNILGTNAIYPISLPEDSFLRLIVNRKVVDVSLINFFDNNTNVIEGVQDGTNAIFTYYMELREAYLAIYKNGRRLKYTTDYTYTVSSDIATITFIGENIPASIDTIVVNPIYVFDGLEIGKDLVGTKDGMNNAFNLPNNDVPKQDSLKIFKNGLLLQNNLDYTATETGDIKLDPEPLSTDSFVVDYQIDSPAPYYIQQLSTVKVTNFIYHVITPAGGISYGGKLEIHKNGLLAKEFKQDIDKYDYRIVSQTSSYVTITFTDASIDSTTIITAYLSYQVISINTVVNYLNNSVEFLENCLFAEAFTMSPALDLPYLEKVARTGETYFTLPVTDFPLMFKIYKNGLKQYNHKDYIIDPVNQRIVFLYPVALQDRVAASFIYKTNDVVFDEFPSGPQNGVNREFYISNAVYPNSEQVYYNGLKLDTNNYTIVGNILTLTSILLTSGDYLSIDYQPAYVTKQVLFNRAFHELPTGHSDTFTFDAPVENYVISVFKNGLRLLKDIDYVQTAGSVKFITTSPFPPVHEDDALLLEVFLTSYDITKDIKQLKIVSPYELELSFDIDPNGTKETIKKQVYKALFGDGITLFPGKNQDGNFYYYIRKDSNEWKYTNISFGLKRPSSIVESANVNLATTKIVPFKKGEHLTARAANDSFIIYP